MNKVQELIARVVSDHQQGQDGELLTDECGCGELLECRYSEHLASEIDRVLELEPTEAQRQAMCQVLRDVGCQYPNSILRLMLKAANKGGSGVDATVRYQ